MKIGKWYIGRFDAHPAQSENDELCEIALIAQNESSSARADLTQARQAMLEATQQRDLRHARRVLTKALHATQP